MGVFTQLLCTTLVSYLYTDLASLQIREIVGPVFAAPPGGRGSKGKTRKMNVYTRTGHTPIQHAQFGLVENNSNRPVSALQQVHANTNTPGA